MKCTENKLCKFFLLEFHYSKLCFFHYNWKAFTYTPVSLCYAVAIIFTGMIDCHKKNYGQINAFDILSSLEKSNGCLEA